MKYLWLLLSIIGALYITAYINLPGLYILTLYLAAVAVVMLAARALADTVWLLTPLTIKDSFHLRKNIYSFGIVVCIMLLLAAVWACSTYNLFSPLYIYRLIGIAGILLLAGCLACSCIKPTGKNCAVTGAVTIALSCYVLIGTLNKSERRVSKTQHPVPTDALEKLGTLPYVSYVTEDLASDVSGVTKHIEELSFKGMNIYNSYGIPGAFLVDMSGEKVHTWLPENAPSDWHVVQLCPNGDLLVIIENSMLMKLDWDSRVLWTRPLRAHHDLDRSNGEKIFVLASKGEIVFSHGIPVPILNDYICVVSPKDGSTEKQSVFDILNYRVTPIQHIQIHAWLFSFKNMKTLYGNFKKHGFLFSWDTPMDVFHTNTIEIITRDIPGLCRQGDMLICVCKLHLIGIVDHETEQLIWQWGEDHVKLPHHPTLLKNGNLLIYDNNELGEQSRIIELNPLTKEIVWSYGEKQGESFENFWGGANQRLPNGNTLITDSNHGRVFEVTRDGTVVWEFFNPVFDNRIQWKEDKRATIYRMMRITDASIYDRLCMLLPEDRCD